MYELVIYKNFLNVKKRPNPCVLIYYTNIFQAQLIWFEHNVVMCGSNLPKNNLLTLKLVQNWDIPVAEHGHQESFDRDVQLPAL